MLCVVPITVDAVESGLPSREVACSRTVNTVCVAPTGVSGESRLCRWDADSSGGVDVDMLCYNGPTAGGAREGEGEPESN
jgi:hypothetical protein